MQGDAVIVPEEPAKVGVDHDLFDGRQGEVPESLRFWTVRMFDDRLF